MHEQPAHPPNSPATGPLLAGELSWAAGSGGAGISMPGLADIAASVPEATEGDKTE